MSYWSAEHSFRSQLGATPGAATTIQTIVKRGDHGRVASSTEPSRLRESRPHNSAAHSLVQCAFRQPSEAPDPASDAFLYAASQVGFDPSETIVVQDSVADVLARKRAGMKVHFTGDGTPVAQNIFRSGPLGNTGELGVRFPFR
ncbi:HAD hydrolase-like protein [Rhizobium leguminosarum]|uniref:HAD hydrolase-like protein n=1 Tax=Rhizobium leguminosarum TaxID=384 RepID=UPI0039658B51